MCLWVCVRVCVNTYALILVVCVCMCECVYVYVCAFMSGCEIPRGMCVCGLCVCVCGCLHVWYLQAFQVTTVTVLVNHDPLL